MANKTSTSPTKAGDGSNINNSHGGGGSPMHAMAATARDKFSASARELMKNLEEAMTKKSGTNGGAGNCEGMSRSCNNSNKGSNGNDDILNNKDAAAASSSTIETAIRAMFSSCTSGSAENVMNTNAAFVSNGNNDSGMVSGSSGTTSSRGLSSSSSSSASTRSARQRQQPRQRPRGRSSTGVRNGGGPRDSPPRAQERKPATTKTNANTAAAAAAAASRGVNESYAAPSSSLPQKQQQKDLGEHIYAQLFFDDQIRAAKAVKSKREDQNQASALYTAARSHDGPHPSQQAAAAHQESYNAVTGAPLPVHQQQALFALPPPPLASTELDISANLTFDDSISAISAHTLEAMARQTPSNLLPVRSDLTQDPSLVEDQQQQLLRNTRQQQLVSNASPPAPTLGASQSPFAVLPRSRSHQTANSAKTKNSGSTRTTQSSSFENWHRQEEQKYWQEEAVKLEEEKSSKKGTRMHGVLGVRKNSTGNRPRRNSTSSHAGSNSRGGNHQFQQRHPHETFRYDNEHVYSYNNGFEDKEPVACVDKAEYIGKQRRASSSGRSRSVGRRHPAHISEI